MAMTKLLFPELDLNPEAIVDKDSRYTPPTEVEKVRSALGGTIGLDPTSNPQRSVGALHSITQAEDCFKTDWIPLLADCPNGFMNPPFSNSEPFLKRMTEYLKSGHIKEFITLTLPGIAFNKRTQELVKQYAIGASNPYGRINFVGGGGSNDRDCQYTLWGCNANFDRFADCMSGLCFKYYTNPRG